MSVPCKHWRDCLIQGGGCCAIGVDSSLAPRPSSLPPLQPAFKTCARCGHYDGPTRGAGDVVHEFAAPIGRALHVPCVDRSTGRVKPTSLCAKIRAGLNHVVPASSSEPLNREHGTVNP